MHQQDMQERISTFFVCMGNIIMSMSLALGLMMIMLEKLGLFWRLMRLWSWLLYQTIFITNGWYIDMPTWTLYNRYIDTPLWLMGFFVGFLLVLAGWAMSE